jgi:predicted nucleic acid-binding protein
VILLDTNVVSAMMSPIFDPVIDAFTARHSIKDLYLPSIALAEIRFGIKRLPAGKRQTQIAQNLESFLALGFAARLLNFGADCAEGYATARAARQKAGRPVSAEDAFIGGMALAYGATLATRNTADFEGYGLTLIDPWTAPPTRK